MKATAIVAMAAVAGITARPARNVTVYLNNDLNTGGVMYQAQEKAAKAFAEVRRADRVAPAAHPPPSRRGSRRSWFASQRIPLPIPAWCADVCKSLRRCAHTVFWDRIESQCRLAPSVVVPAHLLVHEITHILQGVNWHSESGVMKSRWTAKDQRAMASLPLPFTTLDVELFGTLQSHGRTQELGPALIRF
jgi:hypothetical protein